MDASLRIPLTLAQREYLDALARREGYPGAASLARRATLRYAAYLDRQRKGASAPTPNRQQTRRHPRRKDGHHG